MADRIRTRTRRPAYTLTDLCVGLAALALLLALALPAVRACREQSNRSKCANNLRQIALAAIMYASDEVRTGAFPRTYFDTTGLVGPTQYTGANSPASFPMAVPAAPGAAGGPAYVFTPAGGPAANDVTAGMYLILKTQEVMSDVFVCPTADAEPWELPAGDDVKKHANFPSRQHLGYSYANPYPTPAARGQGWKFNNSLGSDYPLAADMSPGGAALLTTPYTATKQQMKAVNSPNHQGEGQNVVYTDAHVEFQQTPFCGAPRDGTNGPALPYRDNIYTCGVGPGAGGAYVNGPPADAQDMVLLPTMADGFQPPAHRKRIAGVPPAVVFMGAIGLLVLAAGTVVLVVVFRKRAAAPSGWGLQPEYPPAGRQGPFPPPSPPSGPPAG